jgi:hypothetical protein
MGSNNGGLSFRAIGEVYGTAKRHGVKWFTPAQLFSGRVAGTGFRLTSW